ncbi:MAG: sodium:proton antiporter, partial [Actinomyces sp.]|nr:sodium:proton antiporter [Actinomyces sp.]
AMAMIFIGSGWVRIAGIVLGVVLVGISLWRIARARTIELATRTQGIDI